MAGTTDAHCTVSSPHPMRLGFTPIALHMLGECPATHLQPSFQILSLQAFLVKDLFIYFMYMDVLSVCLHTRREHEIPQVYSYDGGELPSWC